MTDLAQPAEIASVSELSVSEFRERFEAPARPVVIRGGARSWPAVGRWSPAYLSAKLGSVRIPYKSSVSNKHPDFHQALSVAFTRGESTLAEFLDAITSGTPEERAKRLFTGDERGLLRRRDGRTTLDQELALLWEEVKLPAFVPDERLYTVWAWLSGPGVRTWLHYDNNGCHNVNAQLAGRKSCLLFEPNAVEPFYFFEPGGANPAHNCSAVDVDAPDLERFPRFADARPLRAELETGDLLFIPAFWPHAFLHRGEFNANVNFWWKPERGRDDAVSRRQAELNARAP